MTLIDDGLVASIVGPWASRKYSLVRYYADMFATSMKNRWNFRIYVDLFAGAGRSKIRGTHEIVLASPLLALSVKDRFDRYIFCEINETMASALRSRVNRDYSDSDVTIINGDANNRVSEILDNIPVRDSLTFCFVDPYRLSNLKFETIKELSKRKMDFLILVPTYMDVHRNRAFYSRKHNEKVDQSLGDPEWREKWKEAELPGRSFGKFFVESFGRRMESLQYYNGIQDSVLVKGTRIKPLYHLVFFSKHELGMKFWKEARDRSDEQGSLDFN